MVSHLYKPNWFPNLPRSIHWVIAQQIIVRIVRAKKCHKPKKRSAKNFTSDLDSLFEDALRDTLQEKAQKIVKDDGKTSPARKRKVPALFGLDALIRRTVEGSIEEVDRKKRVTFIFDKMRLAKLKKIARKEKSYLKDIIGEVMSEYIKEYEAEYGPVG